MTVVELRSKLFVQEASQAEIAAEMAKLRLEILNISLKRDKETALLTLHLHLLAEELRGSEAAYQRASAECERVRAQLADMTEGRRTDGVKARRRLAVSVAREAIEREAIEAALTTKLDELGMKYVIETSGLSLESNTKTSKLVHLETVFKAQIRQLRREKDAEIEQLTEEKAKLAAK
ncbi:hypothetical protein Ctob_004123, partial [Chrysochromulina tobinii]